MAAAAARAGIARLVCCGSREASRRKLGSEPWVRISLKAVALRIGLFLWTSYCIADSAVGRECPCVMGFMALAREPPILCWSKKSSHMLSLAEQDWLFPESSKAYLSVPVCDREVSRMTVISGLVDEFTEWIAYSGGLKRSAPVFSLCEEYCITSKVSLTR